MVFPCLGREANRHSKSFKHLAARSPPPSPRPATSYIMPPPTPASIPIPTIVFPDHDDRLSHGSSPNPSLSPYSFHSLSSPASSPLDRSFSRDDLTESLLTREHKEAADSDCEAAVSADDGISCASPLPSDGGVSGIGSEYHVETTVKLAWLGTYFMFSMMLTLFNKFVLGRFRFPWLLTFLHTTFASIGTFAMSRHGHFKLTRLTRRDHFALALFSALFTLNIAVSNLSLALVSVPFFQTMRMMCPIFTVIIFRLWYSRTYSTMTYLSLIPVILGAAMTTVGELSFTDIGFLMTILGVVLAAVKTVVTNRFMTGSLALPALEFLMRMSPLAALQALVCAVVSGELSVFSRHVSDGKMNLPTDIITLAGNGFLAFMVNIASFQTNKLAGALTMTVSGNLKQSLTLGLGIVLFGVHVSYLNGIGMLITMAGAGLYSKSELESKRSKSRRQQEEASHRLSAVR